MFGEVIIIGTAKTRAQNKYIAKAYDRVNLVLAKGLKEEVAEHAAARGESLNGYINRAIAELMAREKTEQEEK